MPRSLVLLAMMLAAACGTSKPSPERIAKDQESGQDGGRPKNPTVRSKSPLPDIDIPAPDDETTRHVVAGLNHFTFAFHRVASSGGENTVLSPASIALALGMVRAGAKGDTAKEIADALHLERPAPVLDGAFAALLTGWNAAAQEDVELAIVDRLFGDTAVPFERGYVDLTGRAFGAAMQLMNFRGAPDASRAEINTWVAKQTHDRVLDLLPGGAVTEQTRLVLVNAIYFKGSWAREFDPKRTLAGDFFAPGGKTSIPMMRRVDEITHAAVPEANASLVELPYRGESMAMVVLLPDARDGLAALESKLDPGAVERWIASAKPTRVDLALPKFRLQMAGALLLKAPLQELGIRRMFDYAQADLTGIAPASEMLQISEGYHKAFVEVDESGTEAAAASALAMIPGGAPGPSASPVQFHADRPFLFLVRDTRNGAILFIGRVTKP